MALQRRMKNFAAIGAMFPQAAFRHGSGSGLLGEISVHHLGEDGNTEGLDQEIIRAEGGDMAEFGVKGFWRCK